MHTPQRADTWETILAGPMAARSVERVICTHMHPDHVGMAGWLTRRFDCDFGKMVHVLPDSYHRVADGDEFLIGASLWPARSGRRQPTRVLRSARASGVRRVALNSAFGAARARRCQRRGSAARSSKSPRRSATCRQHAAVMIPTGIRAY
jgi:hypothetical protein